LKENNIEFHFTIVGDGDQRDWLAEQFKSEISSGIVEMTGVINHEEVYKRMADADVFLYPTRLDSFGLVIAEAMMNGAVPVVTNLPGITDNLIRDKFDGYLIEKNDINGFSSTIIKLATDKGLLAKMSDAAYQRATAALSIEQMETNYINYFCSL
jgi:glycosyltransferase involved in cell wall biosynthesis